MSKLRTNSSKIVPNQTLSSNNVNKSFSNVKPSVTKQQQGPVSRQYNNSKKSNDVTKQTNVGGVNNLQPQQQQNAGNYCYNGGYNNNGCSQDFVYLNDGYVPTCTQALFNSFYGYVMNSTSTSVPFTITTVGSPTNYCNSSNFVIQLTLETGYSLEYVNPNIPGQTTTTSGRPGQLFVLANLGTALTTPTSAAGTTVDYSLYNSLYYILSTPSGTDQSYYLVGFNLAYFECNDAIWIHGNIIDSNSLVQGQGNGIYIISSVNYQTCTFTLISTGLEGYNRYQPVHISQNYNC